MSDSSSIRPDGGEAPRPDPLRIIRWVALAILAWGVFHAVGAWRLNRNPLRAVVVLACVAAFLGFWMALLALRQRRLARRGHDAEHADDP